MLGEVRNSCRIFVRKSRIPTSVQKFLGERKTWLGRWQRWLWWCHKPIKGY